MIKCGAMSNIVFLIHKQRNDIDAFINEFPDSHIYGDFNSDYNAPYLVRIEHSGHGTRSVLGNGIKQIYNDFPGNHIVFINDTITIEDTKKLISGIDSGDTMIIASNDNGHHAKGQRQRGLKIITTLFNLVHRQQACNILSNIQMIPAQMVKHFINLKGDICRELVGERFIIKDNKLPYRYITLESDVSTDAPRSLFGYLKCIFIICFVFIKFMISSVSAFVLDYSLAILGYTIWSPILVGLLENLSINMPWVMYDKEIISTAIARIISSIYNYFINKKVVFSAEKNVSRLSTACKYFTLVLIIWVFNTIILKLATTALGISFPIAKIIADVIMYFVSFTVQRDIIFHNKK